MNLFHAFSTPFFKALGWSLLHSVWQAAIVFSLMKIILHILRQAKSSVKYMVAYSSVIIIAAWFCCTLFRLYTQAISAQLHDSFSIQIMQHAIGQNTANTAAPLTAFVEYFLPALLAFYIAGLCFMTVRLSNNYIQTIRLKSSTNQPLSEIWQQTSEALRKQIGLTKKYYYFFPQA